jgi:RNA polymerase sigma-70 factor (ECF subfamily)
LAQKRGGEVLIVGEEFLAILDDGSDLAAEFEASRAGRVINAFLERSTETERDLFVMRFYFNESYPRICKLTGFSEGKVKMILMRERKNLRKLLEKEGVTCEDL